MELKGGLKKLSPLEELFIEKRMEGDFFSEMSEDDLRLAADKIILECSAITGCELPFTELFAETLAKSMIDFFIKFGYIEYTLSEVILAMKINLPHKMKVPSGIELQEVVFSGRCVNLTFISKVLHNFSVIRNHIDRRFQNLIDGHE